MRIDEGYTIEKLYNATLSLVDGEGTIDERLASAGLNLVIRGDDFVPTEFRGDYAAILADLTASESIGDEGRLEATI